MADVNEVSKREKKDWLSYFNPQSNVIYKNALVWDHMNDVKEFDRFQFERVGYFCVDKTNRTPEFDNKLVFNGIVALKESAAKKGNK